MSTQTQTRPPALSVHSHPERGPWGRAGYRGNCSGHVYKSLFEQLRPRTFVDPCVGSGTSVEVARELGITAVGLDLSGGFNALRDSLRLAAGLGHVDLTVSHLPYHDLIFYSGSVWGEPHPDDLSRCASVEEFLEKAHAVLLNQRDAVRRGGVYATIIGDQRKGGQYHSFQAELIARLPRSELRSVQVKVQHNTTSGRRSYGPSRWAHIAHEYIILWERTGSLGVALTLTGRQHQARAKGTWRATVRAALVALGGRATLSALYAAVFDGAAERIKANSQWQAKVRQTLQLAPEFTPVARGEWALSA